MVSRAPIWRVYARLCACQGHQSDTGRRIPWGKTSRGHRYPKRDRLINLAGPAMSYWLSMCRYHGRRTASDHPRATAKLKPSIRCSGQGEASRAGGPSSRKRRSLGPPGPGPGSPEPEPVRALPPQGDGTGHHPGCSCDCRPCAGSRTRADRADSGELGRRPCCRCLRRGADGADRACSERQRPRGRGAFWRFG